MPTTEPTTRTMLTSGEIMRRCPEIKHQGQLNRWATRCEPQPISTGPDPEHRGTQLYCLQNVQAAIAFRKAIPEDVPDRFRDRGVRYIAGGLATQEYLWTRRTLDEWVRTGIPALQYEKLRCTLRRYGVRGRKQLYCEDQLERAIAVFRNPPRPPDGYRPTSDALTLFDIGFLTKFGGPIESGKKSVTKSRHWRRTVRGEIHPKLGRPIKRAMVMVIDSERRRVVWELWWWWADLQKIHDHENENKYMSLRQIVAEFRPTQAELYALEQCLPPSRLPMATRRGIPRAMKHWPRAEVKKFFGERRGGPALATTERMLTNIDAKLDKIATIGVPVESKRPKRHSGAGRPHHDESRAEFNRKIMADYHIFKSDGRGGLKDFGNITRDIDGRYLGEKGMRRIRQWTRDNPPKQRAENYRSTDS